MVSSAKSFLGKSFLIILICFLASCAPSIKLPNDGVSVVKFPADERATIIKNPVNPDGAESGNSYVCSEPPPDVVITSSIDLLAELNLGAVFAQQTDAPGSALAKTALETAQSALQLGERTQTIQAQRDAFFRVCELHANGAITNEEVVRLNDEIFFTLRVLAFAQLFENLPENNTVNNVAFASLLRAAFDRSDKVSTSGGTDSILPSARSCRELLSITNDDDFLIALFASEDAGIAEIMIARSPVGTRERLRSLCEEVLGENEVGRIIGEIE